METWHYLTPADFSGPLTERLRRVPREPDVLVHGLRLLAALLLRAWLRVFHQLRITGREHLPASGPYVLIANHSSHLDALCLAAAVPLKDLQRTCPVAAADYFFADTLRSVVSAVALNAVPFDRVLHKEESLSACRELLGRFNAVLIFFPEGTRSATGALGEFKPGIGALVAGSDVPVVPCHLDGVFEAWPKGRLFPRPNRLHIRIGEPRTYESASLGRTSGERIAEDLRRAVRALETSDDR